MRPAVFLALLWATTSVIATDTTQDAATVDATATPEAMPAVIMARIGSNEFSVADFMQFLSKNPSRVKEATTPDGKAELLREAIANELLMQAMQEEGLLRDNPNEANLQQAYAKLSSKHFPTPPSPDTHALEEYYVSHKSDFGIPASVRLSQIQLRVKPDASDEEKTAVRKRAEAALSRIESGEPFADVAEELTENPRAKANRGDVGFVWRHGDTWLENALQDIDVGEHTKVLPSPVGYDILMATDARAAIITPFEDARGDVENKMRVQLQKTALDAYLAKLADRVGVEIVLDEMKNAYPNGLFP